MSGDLVEDPATAELNPDSVPNSLEIDPELTTERELLRLLSGFELDERIGAGAMGAVWSAVDRSLDRKVAIKLLRPGRHGQRGSERMLREARALARLVHPNVVAVHESGRIVHGLPGQHPVYIVMEHVEGVDLAEWIAQGPRGWREVVELLAGAGRGLAAAHDADLVHRDFKPANVLIDYHTGTAKVGDFGLAAAHDSEDPVELEALERSEVQSFAARREHESPERLTAAGAIIGTPAYMAPEQLLRKPATPASDQFAFCLCLWQALHNAMPWERRSLSELIKAARTNTLVPGEFAPTLPRWLERVLRRGLASDCAERFPDMHALVRELEEGPRRQRRRRVGATLAGTLLVVAGFTGWWGFREAELRETAARSSTCHEALDQLREVWNEGREAELRAAFLGARGPLGEAQAKRLIRLLDQRVDEWSKERRELCEATAERTPTPTEQLVGACLDQRTAELEATLEILAAPARPTVEHALDLVLRGLDLGACAGSSTLAAIPEDPQERREYVELRAAIAGLNAALYQSERDLERDLRRVGARSEAFDHDGLRAAFELVRARHLFGKGELVEQETALIQALAAAGRVGDESLELEALTTLVMRLSEQRRFEEIAWLELRGDVLDARLAGADQIRHGRWLNAKAAHATRRYDYEEAAQLFATAAEAYTAVPESEELRLNALLNRAVVMRRLGWIDQARAEYEASIPIITRLYGPDDDTLFLPHLGLGLIELSRDTAKSRVHFERARELMQMSGAATHKPELALVTTNLALAAQRAGALEQALEHGHEAETAYTAMGDRQSGGWLTARLVLAGVLVDLGRLAEAERWIADAHVLLGNEGDAHPRASELMLERARLALARGRPAAAAEHLSWIRSHYEPGPAPDVPFAAELALAEARVGLAQGELAETEALLRRALELAPESGADTDVAFPALRLLLAELLWRRAEDEGGVRARARRSEAHGLTVEVRRSLRAAELSARRAQLLDRAEAWLDASSSEPAPG